MQKFMLFGVIGAASLGAAACGDYDGNEAAYNDANAAYAEGNGNYSAQGGNYAGQQTASADWPEGSRIVVEQGVTYRVMPDGVRVRLGPEDSRIEVVDGVRYRIDPGGTRVRIDERGAAIITTDVDAVGANVNAGMNVGGDTSVGVTVNRP